MDHITQLKNIRADAIARMRNSADFKLAGKLGLLIVELGDTIDEAPEFEEFEETVAAAPLTTPTTITEPVAETVSPFSGSFSKPLDEDLSDLTSDEMIDELVAEIEGDAAELDAIMAEQSDDEEVESTESTESIGPFLKPESTESRYTNGATH